MMEKYVFGQEEERSWTLLQTSSNATRVQCIACMAGPIKLDLLLVEREAWSLSGALTAEEWSMKFNMTSSRKMPSLCIQLSRVSASTPKKESSWLDREVERFMSSTTKRQLLCSSLILTKSCAD
jgi:hypothetical protein